MTTDESPIPGDGVGSSPVATAEWVVGGNDPGAAVATAADQSIKDGRGGTAAVPIKPSVNIGGETGGTDVNDVNILQLRTNPFTGVEEDTVLKVKTRNERKGETVLREWIILDLEDIC